MARFNRADGREVYFLTGTDEHGQKVEQSAVAAGKSPLQFADEVSAQFRRLVEVLGCSHDDFIRTTEARHRQVCVCMYVYMCVCVRQCVCVGLGVGAGVRGPPRCRGRFCFD